MNARKVLIVGGGIAGLCAGVYARRCGYDATIVEQHSSPGGLATSWRRGEYRFETCLHWLMGSSPRSQLYPLWREVCDIDSLHFVYRPEFLRVEHGDKMLRIFSDAEQTEREFLACAPEDAAEIRRFMAAVRSFRHLRLPDASQPFGRRCRDMLALLPYLPALRRWLRISQEDYGRRFKNPLLRGFFGTGDGAQLSALALVMALNWQNQGDGGYPVGGSQALIRLIADNFARLGGTLRLGTRVEKLRIAAGRVTGVVLDTGEELRADWVISAADGHATHYGLLEGKYADKKIERAFDRLTPFPSYVQVSLGIARDLSREPGFCAEMLDSPLAVDPMTQISQVPFRIFNYDPSFAPPGKTAVTAFLPTKAFDYWQRLRRDSHERYEIEKQRVADAVIAVLDKRIPGVRAAIEFIDVATPASVIRYTGNWKGSMEGWLLTPRTGMGALPGRLRGLEGFRMIGQWVMAGGGLPSGVITARAAMRDICKLDQVPWGAS